MPNAVARRGRSLLVPSFWHRHGEIVTRRGSRYLGLTQAHRIFIEIDRECRLPAPPTPFRQTPTLRLLNRDLICITLCVSGSAARIGSQFRRSGPLSGPHSVWTSDLDAIIK